MENKGLGFILLLFLTFAVHAKTIKQEGCFILRMNKRDVQTSFTEKLKKELGESYSIPLDIQKKAIFVPDIMMSRFLSDTVIQDSLFRGTVSDTIFCYPSYDAFFALPFSESQKSNCKKCEMLLNRIYHLSPFYVLQNELYFYKIIRVQALFEALETKDILPQKKQEILSDYGYEGPTPEAVVICYLQEIMDYNPYFGLFSGLNYWLPLVHNE